MPTLLEQYMQQNGHNAPASSTLVPATNWNMPQPPLAIGRRDATPPSIPYTHGQNGLFYLPTSQDGIVSLIMGSRSGGLLGEIPVFTSDPYGVPENVPNVFGATEWIIDSYLTGVTEGGIEDFDNQPTGDCVDGPEGGLMQLCTFYNPLARYRGSTRPVSALQAGRALNHVDARAFQLLNVPAMAEIFGTPDNMPDPSTIVLNEMAHRLWTLLFSFYRAFRKHLYSATPANNSGERRFITGVNQFANAGNKYDIYGNECPAADWVVKNKAYELFSETATQPTLYELMEIADYEAHENAAEQGIEQIDGVIAMRSELFFLLSETIPVDKFKQMVAALETLSPGDRARLMISADTSLRDRDDMRTNKLIPLNGRLQRVVIDDGIERKTNTSHASQLDPGEQASDVYFIPITVNGGQPATFFDAFFWNNARTMQVVNTMSPNVFTFTTDNGLWRWYVTFEKGCVQMTFDFLPRLKSKFPVGWRIGNTKYIARTSVRSMFPDDPYYKDGGYEYGITPAEPSGIWDYSDSASLDA